MIGTGSKSRKGEFSRARLLASGCLLVALQSLLSDAPAFASVPAPAELPTGGIVTSGQATVSTTGAQMNVNQGSRTATLTWNSFNVGSQAEVNFHQPDAGSKALNRVIAGDASQIYGRINANGEVFLINPKGIVFGPGSQVNAAGVVASTLDISDENFRNGTYRFERGGAAGTVTNKGTISAAAGGYVALLGVNVTNQGTINAPAGRVLVAAGEKIQVPLTESGLITIDVTPGDVDASVTNDTAGSIKAQGGKVALAVEAKGGSSAPITNNGSIEADEIRATALSGSLFAAGGSSAKARLLRVDAEAITGGGAFTARGEDARVVLNGGYISLTGNVTADNTSGAGGTVAITGGEAVLLSKTSLISANGTSGGSVLITSPRGYVLGSGSFQATGSTGAGGAIKVSGTASTALLGASINASGASNGGTVHVGGDWHGEGDLIVSDTTTVDAATTIAADSVTSGNGGDVVLWSANGTNFYGNITARGGLSGGNGGQVELSSGGNLNVHISATNGVNVLARHAGFANGTVTLDPANIVIGDATGSFDIFKALLSSSGAMTQTGVPFTSVAGAYVGWNQVALNDNYALLGARGVANNRGTAYLYNLSTGAWTDLSTTAGQPITALAASANFGVSVALNSTHALIGSYGYSTYRGNAYLYNFVTGAWTSLAGTAGSPIAGLATYSYFGYSAALNSNYALLGVPYASSNRGNAYLYNLTTGAWTNLSSTAGTPITALVGSCYVGDNLVLSEKYALIGAEGVSSIRGDAFLYDLVSGAWTTMSSTPGAPTATLGANSYFGWGLDLNDRYAIIAAENAGKGHAYLYNLSTGAWTDLTATPGEPTAGLDMIAEFGYSVGLNNNYALIGARSAGSVGQGNAYLYNLSTGAWTDLSATAGAPVAGLARGSYFGDASALSDDYALIAGYTISNNRGNAFLYNLNSGQWTDLAATTNQFIAGIPFVEHTVGEATGLNETYAVIGGGQISGHGSAFLYNLSTGAWTDLSTTLNNPITTLLPGSYFGSGISMTDTHVLFSAYGEASNRGNGYIYNLGTGAWTDLSETAGQPITALGANSYFALGVGLNSTYALLGAYGVASDRGNAYLYNLSTGAWTDLSTTAGQPITALPASSLVGRGIGLSDSYAIIGAHGVASTRGNAFLYNLSTGAWTDLAATAGQPVTGLAANASFGYEVATHDTLAVIGAYQVNSWRGTAYMYNISTGAWTNILSTTGAPVLASPSYFAQNIAVNDGYVLIGAAAVNSVRGNAYLYNRTTGAWTSLMSTAGAPTLASWARFGAGVSLNSTYALVGQMGYTNVVSNAYLFKLSNNAWTDLSQTAGQPITALYAPSFGISTALNSTHAIVGGINMGNNAQGNAYIYDLLSGRWTDLATTAGQPITTLAPASSFGRDVALNDDYALISADGASFRRGDAYLYNLTSGAWTTLSSTSGQPVTALAADSYFGSSVALNDTYALISARGAAGKGDAYLYNLGSGAWLDLQSTAGQPISALGAGSLFGWSVALNSTYALMSAYGVASSRGNAYLYNLSSGAWTDLSGTAGQPIVALAAGSKFGSGVALNESYALIGAHGISTNRGDAYLYNLSGGWTDLAATGSQPVTALAANSYFGQAVALNETYALVGSYGYTTSKGNAYLYKLAGGAWTSLAGTAGQPVTTLANYSYFGYSVALNDTTALIGAHGYSGNKGNTYLYSLSTGKWTDLAAAPSLSVASGAKFGSSVALNDQYALIGAKGTATNRGDAYLYNLSTGFWLDLAATSGQPITALDTWSNFGTSTALGGGYALIGADSVGGGRGNAYLYNIANGTWTDLALTAGEPITSLASDAYFGTSAALNNGYALVGAYYAGPSNQGGAYLYNLSSGAWTDLSTTAGAPVSAMASDSYFGYSLALNDTKALIGACYSGADEKGNAYFYDLVTGAWTDLGASTGTLYTQYAAPSFGGSVALTNSYALIGAYSAGAASQGGAYLYNLSTETWTDLSVTPGQPITTLAGDSRFGSGVALNDTHALIGAYGINGYRGNGFVYNLSDGTWTNLSSSAGQPIGGLVAAAAFGMNVALNTTHALISATGATAYGQAYLIDIPTATSSLVTPETIQNGLAGGNYVITADNDLTIRNMRLMALNTGNSLTLKAGRSILVETDTAFGGRTVTLLANAPNADLGSAANRSAGAAGITIESDGYLDDGAGALTLQIGTAASTSRTGNFALAGDFDIDGRVTAGTLLVNGAESAINVAAALTASGAGTALTLNGFSEAFSGSGTLSTPSGTWKIYNTSAAELGTVSLNGLASAYNRYGCAYVGGCTTGAVIPAGSGVLYAYAPTLTVSIASKIYDNTTAATLTGVEGIANGDAITITGAFSQKDAGMGLTVTFTPDVSYGYVIPTITADITPATLSGVITADGKVYDGTTTATLLSLDINGTTYGTDLSNLTISNTAANFFTKNVVAGNYVIASGLSLGGSAAGNYQLNSTTATVNAAITPALLTITGVTANSKQWDGTTAASLNTAASSLGGIVGSDSVWASGGTGTFASSVMRLDIPVTATAFTLGGAEAQNYLIPSMPTGLIANITPSSAMLAAESIISSSLDGLAGDIGQRLAQWGPRATVSVSGGFNSPLNANIITYSIAAPAGH